LQELQPSPSAKTAKSLLRGLCRSPYGHFEAQTQPDAQPFDAEAWEERAAIAEFDGGLSRQDAERLAWIEDERRRYPGIIEAWPEGGEP
jgi:hypothetical protein